LTVKTEMNAVIDFANSEIKVNKKNYSFDPVGKAAQELIVVGGLENWVKNNLIA
jgi:hypothetical protein